VQAQKKKPHSPQSYQIKPCSSQYAKKTQLAFLLLLQSLTSYKKTSNSYKTTKNTLVSMGVLKMFVLEALAMM
jgi:hypothetical protein